MEFMHNFLFQMSIFFRKMFHDFLKFFIKSLIHKIKQHKNFQNFLQVQMNEVEKKMSKIIKKLKKK